jgi:hypothetical protein
MISRVQMKVCNYWLMNSVVIIAVSKKAETSNMRTMTLRMNSIMKKKKLITESMTIKKLCKLRHMIELLSLMVR